MLYIFVYFRSFFVSVQKTQQQAFKMSLQEINAAEQLMKLAINKQSHVDSLVGYYRDLIDSYNNERGEWVLHCNNLNVTAEDQHQLQVQLKHAQVQISDLHQQLALKKAELMAERQRFFKLMENNGVIKRRLQQSKANYRELMNTCKPVGLNNKQLNTSLLNGSRMDDSKLGVLKQKTNQKTTELQLELINTVKSHAEKKRKMKQKIDSLKSELTDLMFQYQEREDEDKSEYQRSLQRLIQLEKKHIILTQQYFRFRSQNSIQEKRIQQQNEIIRLKNLLILQKLKNLQKSHSEQFKNVDNEVKKQNKKFKNKYDEQLRKKQEHLKILKQQHERISDIYTNKLTKLNEDLRVTNEKLRTTEDKTKVQVSSLRSQIRILRARLQKEGIHQLRRQIANDEQQQSSQSLDIEQLEKINQEVKNLQRQLK